MVVYWVGANFGLKAPEVKKAIVVKETRSYLYLDRLGPGFMSRLHRNNINRKLFLTPWDAKRAYIKAREFDVKKAHERLADSIDELHKAENWVKECNEEMIDKDKGEVICPHNEEDMTFDRDGGSFCNACKTTLS